MPTEQERFMAEALALAHEAAQAGEVPVGCVIVQNGQIVGRGRNRREEKQATASHAEMEAIAQANEILGTWRLEDCELYVTLEPCVMCAGLMHQARVDRCVYGAADPKAGALGTLYAVNADERLNHTFEAVSGVLGDECAELLRSFFARKRKKRMESK